MIKSPLNYTGGKFKLLPQILPLFPQTNNFLDLFCGGCNVSVNVNSNKITCNDNQLFLIGLYKELQTFGYDKSIQYIDDRINEYKLSKTNREGFLNLRIEYNKTKKPLDLYVLLSYSFNNQIRFNNNHEYNSSFGINKHSFNDSLRDKFSSFVKEIENNKYNFICNDFRNIDYSLYDFIYIDPPYLISTGSYNDGKRGFEGWTEKEEKALYNYIKDIDNSNIKFAMSNVFENSHQINNLLIEFSKKYNVHYLNYDYSNANYQKKGSKTIEVLITNY